MDIYGNEHNHPAIFRLVLAKTADSVKKGLKMATKGNAATVI